ncbi:MAG: Valine--tRNA ligase [Tenericutes bacterium ADurb.Bin087]|nr:MAG: Valine--tRNA ligase [Tenericutes bacterium ADurb.Bin087]
MKLDTHYNHHKVEKGRYEHWKQCGYFKSGDLTKPKFSVVIPPPNVTGMLHLGHAWDNTFQDIIARYKKAQGFDVLYLPGMDHAGIATQARIEGRLREKGVSRYDLGREKFLEEAWKWKEEYANTIRGQWQKLGLMLDYDRERFTLDKGLNAAVNYTFVELYKRGYLYQGERIINWDPVLQTALSNIEVIHKDVEGAFYYFKYKLVGSDFYLSVATTRPETMFADVALVINPHDKRYTKYLGKKFINPVNNELIPLIADDYVALDFGTGVMKCTPAHDANDFKIGERHNLSRPICLNKDATLNERGLELAGLDRFVAREKLVKKMKELNLLLKIEKIVHNVGHSERSDAVIEPYLSKQWFLRMDHFAQKSIQGQQGDDPVHFYPKRFNKTYLNWMEIAEDWCVSRQIWWGHRIPAYYHKVTGEVVVSATPPQDIENYQQDEDVLDTWFSSALWPFSTLDWPSTDSELFKRYYPTDVMVTGYDIIFFWVSRMIFMGLELTGEKPFKDVVIHGLIRDEQGRKMSKSLGNGVDPIEVIDKYGVDSLRYFLAGASTPGQDARYIEARIQASVNYLNKIWNAARFLLLNLPADFKPSKINHQKLHPVDAFILHRYYETVRKVTTLMDKYELGMASNYLYSFVYDDYCSNYIEMVKVILNKEGDHTNTYNVMYHTLHGILMMIYPYSPFISEEIYLALPSHLDSIMLASYPKASRLRFKSAEQEVTTIINLIKEIRNFKSTNNLAPNTKMNLYVADVDFELKPYLDIISRLGFINEFKRGSVPIAVTRVTLPKGTFGLELDVDRAVLITQLEKEIETLTKEVERSNKLLNNPGFTNKAPASKVAEEQEKARHYAESLALAKDKLNKLR